MANLGIKNEAGLSRDSAEFWERVSEVCVLCFVWIGHDVTTLEDVRVCQLLPVKEWELGGTWVFHC